MFVYFLNFLISIMKNFILNVHPLAIEIEDFINNLLQ